jgi:hypothetical protein
MCDAWPASAAPPMSQTSVLSIQTFLSPAGVEKTLPFPLHRVPNWRSLPVQQHTQRPRRARLPSTFHSSAPKVRQPSERQPRMTWFPLAEKFHGWLLGRSWRASLNAGSERLPTRRGLLLQFSPLRAPPQNSFGRKMVAESPCKFTIMSDNVLSPSRRRSGTGGLARRPLSNISNS